MDFIFCGPRRCVARYYRVGPQRDPSFAGYLEGQWFGPVHRFWCYVGVGGGGVGACGQGR
jgi:hypothetical protein